MKTFLLSKNKCPLPVFRLPLILASGSPRRAEMLRHAGFTFKTVKAGLMDETWTDAMTGAEIPLYVAEQKTRAYLNRHRLEGRTVLITADTIVWSNKRVLGKPKDRNDAVEMLRSLSGAKHSVITGVCLTSNLKQLTFHEESIVKFAHLSNEEIDYYVDTCKPFDKAGSYGIQEWIGLIGIASIEGSYHNVVGLPVQQLYQNLKHFED